MVNFPPLMPSVSWVHNYLLHIMDNHTEAESIIYANGHLETSRDFGRYPILDTTGNALTLSLAVEGGGRQLRSVDKISRLNLSGHGDWRKNHLGAWEAGLGRKPFYPYIIENFADVYLNEDLSTLEEFTTAIFKRIQSFLLGDILNYELKELSDKETIRERGKEIAKEMKGEISSLQYLSTFGKEALTGILAIER